MMDPAHHVSRHTHTHTHKQTSKQTNQCNAKCRDCVHSCSTAMYILSDTTRCSGILAINVIFTVSIARNISPYPRLPVFIYVYIYLFGPGSSAGIATGYAMDGPGIESWWGRDLSHTSRPVLGPPSLLYNGYRVFPGGKGAGVWC
jgi:hypothetical protein